MQETVLIAWTLVGEEKVVTLFPQLILEIRTDCDNDFFIVMKSVSIGGMGESTNSARSKVARAERMLDLHKE